MRRQAAGIEAAHRRRARTEQHAASMRTSIAAHLGVQRLRWSGSTVCRHACACVVSVAGGAAPTVPTDASPPHTPHTHTHPHTPTPTPKNAACAMLQARQGSFLTHASDVPPAPFSDRAAPTPAQSSTWLASTARPWPASTTSQRRRPTPPACHRCELGTPCNSTCCSKTGMWCCSDTPRPEPARSGATCAVPPPPPAKHRAPCWLT